MTQLTQKEIQKLLTYDSATGVFTWNKRDVSDFKKESYGKIWNARFKNKIAGTPGHYGHIRISIMGKQYKAHRLAWLYIYGVQPLDQVDHINHDRTDNRIENLRSVSVKENSKNRRIMKSHGTGVYGVNITSNKKSWLACIRSNYNYIYLGTFNNLFDACCARKSAEVKYNFHPNHGAV